MDTAILTSPIGGQPSNTTVIHYYPLLSMIIHYYPDFAQKDLSAASSAYFGCRAPVRSQSYVYMYICSHMRVATSIATYSKYFRNSSNGCCWLEAKWMQK